MASPKIQVQLETPTGFVALEDKANGYELHAETFATKATSHRKTEISNPYVAGSFVVRSVRENIVEQIVVWVTGATALELAQRVTTVTDAFDQIGYWIQTTTDNVQETWTCQVADYTVETSQAFIFARTALIRAQVPRLPTVVRIAV